MAILMLAVQGVANKKDDQRSSLNFNVVKWSLVLLASTVILGFQRPFIAIIGR